MENLVRDVLVLGDSHSEIFNRPMWLSETKKYNWNLKKIVGATLLGLKNPQSKTKSKIIFDRAIANNEPDAIVCLLGEVDCGFLIWNHAIDNKDVINNLKERALENYKDLLNKCKSKAMTFVISVPIPCVDDYSRYPDHDLRKSINVDIRERTNFTLSFNNELKRLCESLGVIFIDLDDLTIGDDGLIQEKFIKKHIIDHHYRVSPYKKILLERLIPALEDNLIDYVQEDFNAKTIIMTRFGINIIDDKWYSNQLLMFESLTYSSLCSQSDCQFYWIVVVDEKAPAIIKQKLSRLLDKTPFKSFLVIIDYDSPLRVKMGSQEWVYEEAIKKIKIGNIVSDPDDLVITGMIDADDIWHKDTIKVVKEEFKKNFERQSLKKQKKSFINAISDGMVLTFKNGCKLHLDGIKVFANTSIFQSMSVFVCSRFISGISCFSSRHKAWESFSNNLNFKKIIIDSDIPMWIYTVHPQQMIFENNKKINKMSSELELDLENYGVVKSSLSNLSDIDPVAVDARSLQKKSFYIKAKSFLRLYSDSKS